jgi:hypothetical protein
MTLDDETEGAGGGTEDLVEALEVQAALLKSVATGGAMIADVEAEYRRRRQEIRRHLRELGVADPFPWATLWVWYGAWGKLGGYAERRAHIDERLDAALEAIRRRADSEPLDDAGTNASGWDAIDARIDELRREIDRAGTLDDIQDVGRRSREIANAAAKVVFQPEMVPAGQAAPGPDDAKRQLDLYLAARHSGGSHDEFRAFIRKLFALAHAVTHESEESQLAAFAAAQGAISLVRILKQAQRLDNLASDEPT